MVIASMLRITPCLPYEPDSSTVQPWGPPLAVGGLKERSDSVRRGRSPLGRQAVRPTEPAASLLACKGGHSMERSDKADSLKLNY